jgi:hypothetical protein
MMDRVLSAHCRTYKVTDKADREDCNSPRPCI